MKKLLNAIIVLLGFALLVVLALDAVNSAIINAGTVGFLDLDKFGDIIKFLKTYGAITIVGALVFVNMIAKSLVRIVFVILFLLALVLYIWATANPGSFTSLFGI